MSQQPQWETIEVPRGAYFGWGDRVGQTVTGKVLDYDPVGGTDANGNVCPQLSIEIMDQAYSFSRNQGWTTYDRGELVVINCGLVSLKRGLRAANPGPGDLIKITMANLVPSKNGTVKEMDIKIARGAGGPVNTRQQQQGPNFGQQQPSQSQPPQSQPSAPAFGGPAPGFQGQPNQPQDFQPQQGFPLQDGLNQQPAGAEPPF